MNNRFADRLAELGMEAIDDHVETGVSRIERATGVPLPPLYQEFLHECAGWWGNVCCPCSEPTPFGNHVICSIHDADEVENLLDSMITPRNMITIGSGHFGSFTCLSVCGIDHGAVYALDSEFRSRWPDEMFYQRFEQLAESIKDYLAMRQADSLPEKPESYDSLYLLAPDLETFVARCIPCGD